MAKTRLRFNLALKLWLILFLSTTILVAGLIAWLQISFDRGFRGYLERQNSAHVSELAPQLVGLYQTNGSWQPLLDQPLLWRQLERDAWLRAADNDEDDRPEHELEPDHGEPRPPPDDLLAPQRRPPPTDMSTGNIREEPHRRESGEHERRSPHAIDRLALADAEQTFLLGAERILDDNPNWTPLLSNNQIIGYLGYGVPKRLKTPREVKFLKRQSDNVLAIGALALVISGVFAFPLAAFLVRPIKRLETSTKALTRGDYQTRVHQISNDELGSLALHFNELAATLEANQQSRRKWVADISHELRTPVTFIKGQIEALIDGIRPTNKENLQALETQINHLSKLIDELYQLSQSELGGMNYKKHWLPVAAQIDLAARQAAAVMVDKGLNFTVQNQVAVDYLLFLDESRFAQLLNNLLANSLRHTDAPGEVRLLAISDEERLTLILEDSAPGVADEELPKLFDRLYRADHSRNSETGGAGIGLTLCRNIVDAHGGKITLRQSDLGGLKVIVTLPVLQQTD